MKRAQLIGLSAAAAMGLLAFMVMKNMLRPAPPPVVVQKTDTAQVLVAREDIQLGQVISEPKLRWQDWPRDGLANGLITKAAQPNAMQDLTGAFSRFSLYAGEPIVERKLVRPGAGGVLSAILQPGKRAVATKIAENTAVGKMILPGDYVDVVLSRRKKADILSEILLRNVRVLAIGQNLEVKDGGRKSADGNVATLELTSHQGKLLAAANMAGEISLALRSIADSGPSGQAKEKPEADSTQVKFLKYGIPSRTSGLN